MDPEIADVPTGILSKRDPTGLLSGGVMGLLSSQGYRRDRLAEEMTHDPFRAPEDIETAKAMIDMLAQEAIPAYGIGRAGQDMMSSLQEGDLGWAALSGLGLLPGIPAITAWHGSPHKFAPTANNPLGEFDASRIGTGEGAQAYGHGLYFAENPETAKQYQRELSSVVNAGGTTILSKNRRVGSTGNSDVDDLLIMHNGDYDKALAEANKSLAYVGERRGEAYREAINVLEGLRGKVSTDISGSVYKVDLPDEHVAKMLDWDKPLSEQPESVRDAVNRVARETESYGLDRVSDDMRGIDLKKLLNSPAGAAQLRKLGVPGIRYLDQFSRGTGEGTRNFVLFDPTLATILSRE